jgi:uncharacterized integral membrane protein
MKKLKRILGLVVFIPLGIILIVLAVANRQVVTLALNPFRPDDAVLAVSAPFFIFLLIAVIAGMVIGSFVTWWNQGKYRRKARVEAREATKWRAEHEAVAKRNAPAQPGTQIASR